MTINKLNILENLIMKQKVAYHKHDGWLEHPVRVVYHQDFFTAVKNIQQFIFNDVDLTKVTNVLSKYGNPCLVGGGVRDALLGIAPKDFDIEVYGIPKDKLGYILNNELGAKSEQVGAQFAVFKVGNFDISLPRKESKIGEKHTDFEVTEDPFMQPESAARRRDFTINALMFDIKSNQLLDFFGGEEDLKNKVIRHIDDKTFVEDALRVYRASQFAARFGFTIAPETIKLASSMDLSQLPKERIFEEFNKLLLKSPKPSVGLEALDSMDVLRRYYPEFYVLHETEQRPDYHAEGNVWNHILLTVDKATEIAKRFTDLKDKQIIMYASLLHDIGKPLVTKISDKGYPVQPGHEEAGVEPAKKFLDKLTNESDIVDNVLFIVEHHLMPASFHGDGASDSAFRKAINKYGMHKLQLLSAVSEADVTGRLHRNEDGTVINPGKEEIDWFNNKLEEVSKQFGVTESGKVIPLITGNDLLGLGMKTGKELGNVLLDIKDKQENGVLTNKDEALKYVKEKYLQKSIKIEAGVPGVAPTHEHDGWYRHPISVENHPDYFIEQHNKYKEQAKQENINKPKKIPELHKAKTGEPIVAKIFHGSDSDFINPKVNVSETGEGVFLTDNWTSAHGYGKNIYSGEVSLKNPFVIDVKNVSWLNLPMKKLIDKAKSSGYDGLILNNIIDDKYSNSVPSNEVIAFDINSVNFTHKINRDTFEEVPLQKSEFIAIEAQGSGLHNHTESNTPTNHPDGNIPMSYHPVRVKYHEEYFNKIKEKQLDESLRRFEEKNKLRYKNNGEQKLPINWLFNKVVDFIGNKTDLSELDKTIIKERIFNAATWDYQFYYPKNDKDFGINEQERVLVVPFGFNGDTYHIYLTKDENIFFRKVENNVRPQDSPVFNFGVPSNDDYKLDHHITEKRYDKDGNTEDFEIGRRRDILENKIQDQDKRVFYDKNYDAIISWVPSDHLHKFTGISLNPNDFVEKEVGIYKGEIKKMQYIGFFHPINNGIELYGDADYFSLIHEIGHAVHLSTIGRILGMDLMEENHKLFEEASDRNMGFPSNYSKTNEREFFAECYASYLTSKTSFKDRNYKAFLFMEKVFEHMKGIDDNYLNFGIAKSENKEKESIGDPKGVGRFEEGLPNLGKDEQIEKQFTPKNFNPIRTLTSAFKHETSGKLAQHTHEEHPQNHPDGNMIFPLHPVSVDFHQRWFEEQKEKQGKTGEVQNRGDLFKPSEFELERRKTLYKQLVVDDFSKDMFNGPHYKNIISGGPPASHLLKISKISISNEYWLDNEEDVVKNLGKGIKSISGIYYPDNNSIRLSKGADSFDLIHEIGHSLLHGTVGRQVKDRYFDKIESIYDHCINTDSGFPTDYAREDAYEFFAECYASFVTQNKHFQKRNRQMYDAVHEIFEYFRDADDVFLSTGILKSEDNKKIFIDPKGVGIFNPNLPDLIEDGSEEKIENQNPPRPGLVPQSGDWQHPDRWVLPEEAEKYKEESVKTEEPKKKPVQLHSTLQTSKSMYDKDIRSFSKGNWGLDTIQNMFASNMDNVDVEMTQLTNSLDVEMSISFDLLDNTKERTPSSGGPFGSMVRTFSRELDNKGIQRIIIKHDQLSLLKSYQGKGISSKLLDSMEDEYKKNGVYAIDLDTDEIGCYAWALQGYDFVSKYNLDKIKNHFIKTLRIKLSKNIINQVQFEKMIKEVGNFTHSWEFASWNPTKTQWGKHIGKAWLLNTPWRGRKILSDDNEGYRIGKQYRERKNATTKI